MKVFNIGVLAFHGDVEEHIQATKKAAENLKLEINIILVRTKLDLQKLDGLIIPGGESTTIYRLSQKEGMLEEMKKIRNIFGTCAGAIMLSKKVSHKMRGQKTLELMDIEIDRNAYGRQNESFEETINTHFGPVKAVFIRAPKIKGVNKNINILSKHDGAILACEQRFRNNYYLAVCFHPELTSTLFHEHFLKQI